MIQSLCFPRAAWDPHLITDSSLHIVISHDTCPLAHFLFPLKDFTTVSVLDPFFHNCLADGCLIVILNRSVLHATFCYDTVYCTGLWLKAGLFQVDVLCRARGLHKFFVVQLEGFSEKQTHVFVISRRQLKLHPILILQDLMSRLVSAPLPYTSQHIFPLMVSLYPTHCM